MDDDVLFVALAANKCTATSAWRDRFSFLLLRLVAGWPSSSSTERHSRRARDEFKPEHGLAEMVSCSRDTESEKMETGKR